VAAQFVRDGLSQGIRGWRARRPRTNQSFQGLLEVRLVWVFGDCQSEQGTSFKRSAELFGEPGHLDGMADGLFPVMKLDVTSLEPDDLSLVLEELSRARSLAVLLGKLDQTRKGGQIGRIDGDQALEFVAFHRGIALSRAEPGSDAVKLCL
jgi:hypothetical protein